MWYTFIKNDVSIWNSNLTGRLLFYLATLVKTTKGLWTCHLHKAFPLDLYSGLQPGVSGSFHTVPLLETLPTFISTCTGDPACLDRITTSEQVMSVSSTPQELHILSCFHLAAYENLVPFCGHTELISPGAMLKHPEDSKASWTVGR